jgi:murein DD-endopeptidase MepM/ murein hydrolase activator NlpD
MIGRTRRRTRGRRVAGRSSLSGSLRLFGLLGVLVAINVYVFFFRGGTSLKDVLRTAALPPQQGAALPGLAKSAGDAARGRGRGASAGGRARLGPATVPVEDERLVSAVLEPGDTLRGRLLKLGVGPQQAEEAANALRTVTDLQRVRPGQTLRVRVAGRELRGLDLEASAVLTYRVSREPDGRFRAERAERPLESRVVAIGGTVGTSLYEAVKSAGEQTALVAAIADLFAHDLNFYLDTHPGDTFRVLVEKQVKDGELFRYGRVLAAEYAGKAGTFRCFAFRAEGGPSGYYNEAGQNCAKVLLKTPLKFARLTSRFDRKRMHPVLHVERGHYGVDYGAPAGTPVWASATGKVVTAAKRPGSGNTIVLAHANGMTTHYYHLSKFAKGLAPGQPVKQKQLIGYVGSTGLSTGPHLHFAVKQGGSFIDPLKMKIPREAPLPARYQAELAKLVGALGAKLAQTPVTPAPEAHAAAAGPPAPAP